MRTSDKYLSDVELLQILISKDKGAVEILYNKYSSILNGIISMVLTSREARLDVLEKVIVKIWQDIHQYDKACGSLFIWMINIAHRCAIDEYKSISLVTENYSADIFFKDQLLSVLNPDQFTIFESVYLKGYTIEETSLAIALPVGEVKGVFRQAITAIRIYYNSKELTNQHT